MKTIRTKNIEQRAKTIIVYVPLAKAVYVLCSKKLIINLLNKQQNENKNFQIKVFPLWEN